MNVKLVSLTQSLIEDKPLSAEELIVYIARCSNPSNQLNTDTSERLLRYLIKHKHVSPFDMVYMCVEIKTSRAIAQQILRHWSFDFQEFSQRYAEVVDIEPLQIREAGSTTRQGSKQGEFDPEIVADGAKDLASRHITGFIARAERLYKKLLEAGVAKESARMILPLTTQTTIYMNGSVRSWMYYLAQRLDAHAQLEHQQVAQAINNIFREHFPNVSKAFFNEEEDPR